MQPVEANGSLLMLSVRIRGSVSGQMNAKSELLIKGTPAGLLQFFFGGAS